MTTSHTLSIYSRVFSPDTVVLLASATLKYVCSSVVKSNDDSLRVRVSDLAV